MLLGQLYLNFCRQTARGCDNAPSIAVWGEADNPPMKSPRGTTGCWLRIGMAVVLSAIALPSLASDVDTLKARMAACLACHGETGGGYRNDFNPRIGGQPAAYLLRQLQHYRDGRRSYPMMEHMVRYLSDDYLREMADHLALQRPTPPPPATATVPAAVIERGRQLVLEGDATLGIAPCSGCHGAQLGGRQPDIPGIAGQPDSYISAQFGAWSAATRSGDPDRCMKAIADHLAPGDVRAVAAFVSRQPYALPAEPVTIRNCRAELN